MRSQDRRRKNKRDRLTKAGENHSRDGEERAEIFHEHKHALEDPCEHDLLPNESLVELMCDPPDGQPDFTVCEEQEPVVSHFLRNVLSASEEELVSYLRVSFERHCVLKNRTTR